MGTQLAPQNAQMPSIDFGARGIKFGSFEDLFRFAKCVVASGLAPKGMDKPETIAIAIEMGCELGLPPLQALQNIAVINGRPAVWGDALLAICQQSGLFCFESFSESLTGDGDKQVATCTVRRKPNGQPVTRSFSAADAKRAGLWGKSGPWTQYAPRMLQMRARTFALRDTFADVLRGFTTIEEANEMTPVAQPRTAKMTPVSEILQIKQDGEIMEPSSNGHEENTEAELFQEG